jgi:transcriptional regulator with XRE-family HTH domain
MEEVTMASNAEFATLVGCHYSHASRLRNGLRLPSARIMRRIQIAYGLDPEELFNAYDQGPRAFGRLLRERIFDLPTAA